MIKDGTLLHIPANVNLYWFERGQDYPRYLKQTSVPSYAVKIAEAQDKANMIIVLYSDVCWFVRESDVNIAIRREL